MAVGVPLMVKASRPGLSGWSYPLEISTSAESLRVRACVRACE
jgi:hypothetical protein